MNDNIKQDINFLEYPLWMQSAKKATGQIVKWKDADGYIFEAAGGVPSKVDILYLYYFMLESQKQNWNNNLILSRYQILKGCGVNPSKDKRARLKQCLEVWKRVTITFSGTFYTGQGYKSLEFGIIDKWGVRDDDNKLEIRLSPDWVEKIKTSDFFKYVSFNQMKALRSPLALRLYELLVKTFHQRTVWEIGVLRLAAKIPMTEKYVAHITPKVTAATKRIKEKTELNIKVRMIKQGRGKGKFIFTKADRQEASHQDEQDTVTVPAVPLEDILRQIPGQWRRDAADIAKEISQKDGTDDLEQCISFVNQAIDAGQEIKKGYGRYLRSVWNNGWHRQAAEAKAAEEQSKAAAKVERDRTFLESRRQMPDAILKIDADKGCAISRRVLEERQ
ncbi:MAG: replication initiator protein A [Thermodesulfobacteriota bacterium]|nr:replication initiator protein A [Thermodesulfobacteriota bacterium]